MNILITGASGFIGSNLIKELVGNGKNKVFALVRESTNLKLIPDGAKSIVYKWDIPCLTEKLNELNIDGIVHLASLFLAKHSSSDVDRLIDSNIKLGSHLLEAASKSKIKWFINTSSFWQHYEGKTYSPVALYAATKEAFENIVEYYSVVTDIKFVSVELFDSYGPYDRRQKLFKLLKNAIKENKKFPMSPGLQRLNLVYIDDIVAGYSLLINLLSDDSKKYEKKYSISSKQLMSLREVVATFLVVYNAKLEVEWGGFPYREREVMEPDAIYPLIPGWKQSYDLKDGLEKMRELDEEK